MGAYWAVQIKLSFFKKKSMFIFNKVINAHSEKKEKKANGAEWKEEKDTVPCVPASCPQPHSSDAIYFQIIHYFFWDLFLFMNNLLMLLYPGLQI